MIHCATCGQPFTATRSDARYCSPRCRKSASRRRVTDNPVTAKAVTDNRVTDVDLLDALGARIERGERLTAEEIADAQALCERVLDTDCDDEDQYLAFAVLGRLDARTPAKNKASEGTVTPAGLLISHPLRTGRKSNNARSHTATRPR